MYPDQFDKIGSMPGAVGLSVNKNIHPHIDVHRKTPIALKDYIKQELVNQTGKWKPATITSRCAEPRSYILQLLDGLSKRRNRVQIRAAKTSSHKQVHFNDHTTSLQNGLTNTNNVSHQRSIKQPTCNTTRSGREIHRPKRYEKINKEYSNILLFHWSGGCSNITDNFSTRKITTHTHSPFRIKMP